MELFLTRAGNLCIFTQNFPYFRPILPEILSVDWR